MSLHFYVVKENFPIYPPSYRRLIDNFSINVGPGDIFETADHRDADCFLMMASLGDNAVESKQYIDTDYFSGLRGFDVSILQELSRKPIIFICDSHGPKSPRNYNFAKRGEWLPEKDIPVGWASLPKHPNAQQYIGMISSSVFRWTHRWQKKEKSLILMHDSFLALDALMLEIIPLFSEVFVTSVDEIQDSRFDGFDNLKCGRLEESEVSDMLSKYEYVLVGREDMGLEMMGIEGGFLGCQPIYPNTQFYKDVFSKVSGVALYDTGSPVASLKTIVAARNSETWTKDMPDFVQHFSAEENIPKFWSRVIEMLKA